MINRFPSCPPAVRPASGYIGKKIDVANRGYYMTARGYEFIFECSTRYLTSERSKRVRCRNEHEKIKFISTSGHVIFCLLHKHNNDDVFGDFPKISDQFPKISEDFPKIFPKVRRTFPNIFGHFPKISEEAPMMFRSYSNISKYFL